MKLKYTKEAIQDLIRLRNFIKEKNPDAAARISAELVDGIENLKLFPKLGKKVESAPDPEIMRDIFILDYHIRYLVLEKTIYILRAWHQNEHR